MTQAVDVVARQLPPTRMQRILVGWNAVALPTVIGLNLHLPWWVIALAVAVGAGVLLPLGAALTANRLEITGDALVVRRRLRPVVTPRETITAVDGDVPHSGTRPPETAPVRRAAEPDGPIHHGTGPDGPIYL